MHSRYGAQQDDEHATLTCTPRKVLWYLQEQVVDQVPLEELRLFDTSMYQDHLQVIVIVQGYHQATMTCANFFSRHMKVFESIDGTIGNR